MFQRFNQFLVVATLLSVGIGGFAVPLRRQSETVAFANLDNGDSLLLCLDAADNNPGAAAIFAECEGNGGQAWIIEYGTPDNTTTIQNPISQLCLTINDSTDQVEMQGCSENPEHNQLFVVDAEVGQISTGDEALCIDDDDDDIAIASFCAIGDDTQKIFPASLAQFQE